VEKLLDEDAAPILRYPTRHTRYRITYTMTGKGVDGFKAKASIEKETWATLQVPEEGFDAWLRPGDFPSGSPEFEKLAAALRDTIRGFPLKMTVVNTITSTIPGEPDKPYVTRLTVDVTSLETTAVDVSRFDLPPAYQEQPPPSH
jgi:hypothetical protein